MTVRPTSAAAKEGAVVRETSSEAATQELGKAMGAACRGTEVIALVGPLGAGKTCLVRGLAEGLGVPPRTVASPTFVLIHEYAGRLPLYHVDLYRLDESEAVNRLGLEEYLESAGVTVIEWADRAPAVLPADHLRITMDHLGGDRRRLVFEPRGPQASQLAARALARRAGTARR